MSQAFVDAQITGHVNQILGYGYASENAIKAVQALYATFTQPGLDRVLSRTADGRIVQKLAEQHGIK